jgi:hypothetical protein
MTPKVYRIWNDFASGVGIKTQDFYADFISLENFKKTVNSPPKKACPKFKKKFLY